METASFSNFTYRKLQREDGFRAVVLEPGKVNDPLRCMIIQCSLAYAPAYEALSYVWAQDPGEETIYCNERTHTTSIINAGNRRAYHLMSASERPLESLAVTKNVGVAMRQLRHLDRPRVLWIDQICINQADRDERAQQVLIMGDIYKFASRCIVWLGREYDGSDEVISLVEDLVLMFSKLGIQELMVERLHEFNLPSQESPLWTNLYLFLQRPWFRRIWTSQEIIVLQTAIFMCGCKIITLDTIKQFVSGLQNLRKIKHILFDSAEVQYGPDIGSVQLYAIAYIWAEVRKQNSNLTVLHILEAFSLQRSATDPRDKSNT